jgi:hypothetical protein
MVGVVLATVDDVDTKVVSLRKKQRFNHCLTWRANAAMCTEKRSRAMPSEFKPNDAPTWLELQRIVSLREASKLAGMSEDTLRRRHADKILTLSPRRRGMRLRHALMLPEGTIERRPD